jgi:hypothetical protein
MGIFRAAIHKAGHEIIFNINDIEVRNFPIAHLGNRTIFIYEISFCKIDNVASAIAFRRLRPYVSF